MAWNYTKLGANGRLYSYYNLFQTWELYEVGADEPRRIKVEQCWATPRGVQYYLVSIDGQLVGRRMSAARLHYYLHHRALLEVEKGIPKELPLLIEEVEAYYKSPEHTDNLKRFCFACLDKGYIGKEICECAKAIEDEIKEFNRKQRLAALMK